MYVKSLTLRGFKSFASATTLRLEPGITCIVGPNGSGKSNVVDALSWVMGEQGAKTLRGGKMEDVIFAGTGSRPPLGRAEVSLTIDNTDGALPIAYSEVTLTRTMFRSGGSEYAINGTTCRLLDVQELLSDSGIGREMHVVVGQGQLDSILAASAHERRGFIEEAAGVLKHRRRKERALRKLEVMESNLTRLTDLTGEIRRQLGPLGRQAETARRAVGFQTQARDSRARLLADDLVQLVSALEADLNDEAALVARRTEAEHQLSQARTALEQAETAAAAAGPRLAQAQQRCYALTSLRDRFEATVALAAERARLLGADDGESPEDGRSSGRDPQLVLAEASRIRGQEAELAGQIEQARETLDRASAERHQAEARLTAEQRRLAELTSAAADRREVLATLGGRVAAARSRVEAGQSEVGRLRDTAARAEASARTAEAEFARLESSVAQDEEGEEGLDGRYEEALVQVEQADTLVRGLEDAERAAERDRAGAAARLEVLEASLQRRDGAETLLAGMVAAEGVHGRVASLLTVTAGYQSTLAAALGWLADAVAVDSTDAAAHALTQLRTVDGGRVGMLVPPDQDTPSSAGVDLGPAPDGTVWARSVVDCPDWLRPALDQVLRGVVLPDQDACQAAGGAPTGRPDTDSAEDTVAGEDTAAGEDVVAAAVRIRRQRPDLTVVSAAGDVLAPGSAHGGGTQAPSLIEVQAAAEEARQAVDRAAHQRQQTQFAMAAARERRAAAQATADAALADLHASDARMAAVAEQLGSWGATLRGARAELARTETALTAAEASLAADQQALTRLQTTLAQTEAEPAPEHPGTQLRDQLDGQASHARAAETEARLRVGTLSERVRALSGRADALEAAARTEQTARQEATRRRRLRAAQAEVAVAVQTGAQHAVEQLATAVELAEQVRRQAEADCVAAEAAVSAARPAVDQLTEQVRELTDSVHRDEVMRTELRLRIDALRARAVDELGTDPEVLVEEYGPHRLMPGDETTSAAAKSAPAGPDGEQPPGQVEQQDVAEAAGGVPYRREVVEKRLRVAERQLAQLGRINPLALEEYAALEERHRFLTEQIDDLRRSKRDLLGIVADVDERVQRVFAEAFADTAQAFERVFARLFPGGQGRLLLTDPQDMLGTGIEVEARPPGKKIKRLSLLSGGERSLTAVALLLAIFMARPSPFYILDEVEAALDDTNLGRLLEVLEELRDSSQLIVITHQRRTMEVADALYGVSMRGDGVTTVVSQRLRDARSA